jgi:hypothetical protein
MAKRQSKKKPPELKVVFDSSVLYTGSASDLLNREVAQLIKENSSYPDLTVTWYLPEIVVHERQYQMSKRGLKLLPSIQKLERLLGHNLNITGAIIESRVTEAVERQLQEYGIQVFSLTVENVDWKQVMLNAVYRRPPFDPGENEKGFRDALVAETFLQIVGASPVTPRICRIILVTGDKVLGDAVRSRTSDCSNVRVLETLEKVKSLINTLVAAVSEDFVAKIQEQAQLYFFEPEEEGTLYYKENIRTTIERRFNEELSSLPTGATRRENGTWYISSPRFVKKERQRVFWVSRISVEAKAYKYLGVGSWLQFYPGGLEGSTLHQWLSADLLSGRPQSPSSIRTESEEAYGGLYSLPSPGEAPGGEIFTSSGSLPVATPQGKTWVATGKSIFEVTWSVSVSTNQRFTSPRIESAEFIETSWEMDVSFEL